MLIVLTTLPISTTTEEDLSFTYRTDEHGRKEFRERDADQDREREKERRQREKERIRRQDEERRRRRERQDGETMSKKQEEEVKREKKKCENVGELSERVVKPAKDDKKEDSGKRERLRNKVTVAALHQIVRNNIFVTCFFGIRTDLPFSCTNQGQGAATGLWEGPATSALLPGNQSRSLRKWPTEQMTEQISACDTSCLVRREQTGLHWITAVTWCSGATASSSAHVRGGFWSLLCLNVTPHYFHLLEKLAGSF